MTVAVLGGGGGASLDTPTCHCTGGGGDSPSRLCIGLNIGPRCSRSPVYKGGGGGGSDTHKCSSWERQALRARIRVMSSSPLNVRCAFERLANKHENQNRAP